MKRVAILGGGIAGLAAAYELEQQRQAGKPLDWHLFEATNRLGGIVQTTRLTTPDGDFILEDGPDGWVTEKPWARELAEELGLGGDIITSRDEDKKTYICLDGALVPMPDRMRMMVPEDLATLDNSPLFSAAAKQAYARELQRAEELKAAIPEHDESVASFVRRHFGDEVLEKIGAPLLSGVFGGDVAKLSVRAVMPAFVRMEAENGSLIAGLQAKSRERAGKSAPPTFTSLRRGMGSLVDALVKELPLERLHLNARAYLMEDNGWHVLVGKPFCEYLDGLAVSYKAHSPGDSIETFDHVILATPLDVTRTIFPDRSAADLLPTHASSAVLVGLTWSAELARTFSLPPGFGFLVPQAAQSAQPHLLACTFVDQKFPDRAPAGARILRAFFGSETAALFAQVSDGEVARAALLQLQSILGPLPDPVHAVVSRWPNSLPQYEVGHLDRMAQLDALVARTSGLHLLGNSYRGVGLPDLIRDGRAAARALATA